MAYSFKTSYCCVRIKLATGGYITIPLMDDAVLRIDQAPKVLTGSFANAYQKKVLDKGDYADILNNFQDADFMNGFVLVSFAASKGLRRYPEFELQFEYVYLETENGFWAKIPSLAIDCFADTFEKMEDTLKQSVKLEFARKKRLRACQKIVEAIWFADFEMHSHDISLKFYSPSELENLHDKQKEDLLPKVAKPLDIDQRVTYGREEELKHLGRALGGKFNKCVLLIGPSGVGKSNLIWEISRQRTKFQIKAKIWETTASTLIKELTGDTGWESNLDFLCRELMKRGDILFVRNFLELFEVGQYAGNDVSMGDYMREFIARGEISVISECTDEEFARIELRAPNYLNLFQQIRLDEPKEDLEKIIQNKVVDIAKKQGVSIELEAIKETIRLNKRYTPYSGFPGKPIRFLDSLLLNRKNLEIIEDRSGEAEDASLSLNRSSVIQSFCEETGMPAFMVDPEITMNVKDIRHHFFSNVFGQDQAVHTVVDLLASVKTALTRQGKPIASLLFIGPTGVGKTEMAKVMAEFMFGSREKMIRFDMSEYSSPYSVQRLTGLDFHSDGLLTSAVRREPFCVLLFDEIEKAHSVFYDLLLQILGEGRLTDSRGKLVNFCSTIIVMTSNIGAANLQNNKVSWKKEIDTQDVQEHFMSAVRKHFRPELFNRIDQIIPFEPLKKEVVQFVVQREIELFKKREGIRFRKMDLSIDDSILDYIAENGYAPKYGARKLQRTIRDELIIPLGRLLNGYEYNDQLIVRLEVQNQKPEFLIEADPLKLELLIEELTRNEYSDHSSNLRRKIHLLQEGRFYIRLISELDILERKKKKLKESFWTKPKLAAKYGLYLQTKQRVAELSSQIEKHEMEMCLSTMDLRTYRPAIIDDITNWENEFLSLKIELYNRIEAQANQAYLAIYGKNLSPILNFYFKIFKTKNFEIEAHTLWYRESFFNEEIKYTFTEEEIETGQLQAKEEYRKREAFLRFSYELGNSNTLKARENDDILVGIEIKVKGPCAYLYLSGENGFVAWKVLSQQYKYHVRSGPKPFDHPKDLFRQKYFDITKFKRKITDEHILDNDLKLNRETGKSNFAEIVVKKLDQIFNHKLDDVLL